MPASRVDLVGMGGRIAPRAPVGQKDLKPEVPPTNEAEAERLAAGASYIASRGPDGLEELRRWLAVAQGQPWLKGIQVHGAVVNDWAMVVKMLLTNAEVGCDINAIDKNGYSPLHVATIWGRVSMAVLLLSLGADITVRSVDENESTPSGMARLRLSRLLKPSLDTHEDIGHMRTEGRELVNLFDSVERAGSYAAWAVEHGAANRHVQRHTPRLIANAQRAKLCLLRELLVRGRATVRSVAEQAAHEEALALTAAAKARAAAGPPQTLEAAMTEAGLLKDNPRVMMRQVNKLLACKALADLTKVTRDDIAELDEIDPSERRALWHFVSMQQEKAGASRGGAGGGVGEPAKAKKTKAKAKAKENGDLDTLLSEGIGAGKKKGKPKAEPPAPQAAAAPSGGCGGDRGGEGGGKGRESEAEDYTRQWADQPAVLRFVFRADLPMDAFGMIAKMMYN